MDLELLHDLGLPLQIIQSSAQMLRLTMDAPTPETLGYLDLLGEGVAQLRQLLDGALDRPGADIAPVEAVGLARALCLRCRPCAEARGVRLDFSTNVDALWLRADEALMSRGLLNLIMNALRFTPRGGAVSVRCVAAGDFIELRVRDVGPGIPAERLPYLFIRGETDGGHGYGLPSAADCARRMGGALLAASSPGAGSTFTLRLTLGASRAS